MTCDEVEVLLHALLDGELDAGHARDVEAHIAGCPRCARQLAAYREMQAVIARTDLRYKAPEGLRQRIQQALPKRAASVPDRRTLLKGFAFGSVLSGALAASLVMVVLRDDRDQRIVGEVVSAHLRSLQAEHLTDVQSTDQHTVKPWFNGRLDIAPPVVELTAQGFTLIGGRLDYIDTRPVGALVYKRRGHVINLFVVQSSAADRFAPKAEKVQGFNIRRWSSGGLEFWAVSDLNGEELQEFEAKFESASRTGATM
jgi:mycothiol system anti-sigma-R factor